VYFWEKYFKLSQASSSVNVQEGKEDVQVPPLRA
jgi:hypothetical protein